MPDRFLDAAAWGGDPRVTFHGYDLFLDPTGGSQGDGLVTGVFADGRAFAVHLRGAETASRVRLAEMKYPAQIVGNIGLFHVCYKLSLLGWNSFSALPRISFREFRTAVNSFSIAVGRDAEEFENLAVCGGKLGDEDFDVAVAF